MYTQYEVVCDIEANHLKVSIEPGAPNQVIRRQD